MIEEDFVAIAEAINKKYRTIHGSVLPVLDDVITNLIGCFEQNNPHFNRCWFIAVCKSNN